jgi:hypothetical protein
MCKENVWRYKCIVPHDDLPEEADRTCYYGGGRVLQEPFEYCPEARLTFPLKECEGELEKVIFYYVENTCALCKAKGLDKV